MGPLSLKVDNLLKMVAGQLMLQMPWGTVASPPPASCARPHSILQLLDGRCRWEPALRIAHVKAPLSDRDLECFAVKTDQLLKTHSL